MPCAGVVGVKCMRVEWVCAEGGVRDGVERKVVHCLRMSRGRRHESAFVQRVATHRHFRRSSELHKLVEHKSPYAGDEDDGGEGSGVDKRHIDGERRLGEWMTVMNQSESD